VIAPIMPPPFDPELADPLLPITGGIVEVMFSDEDEL